MLALRACILLVVSATIAHACCVPQHGTKSLPVSQPTVPASKSLKDGMASTSNETTKARDEPPFVDQAFNMTIDSSCQGGQLLELERALGELRMLSVSALHLLVKEPTSDIVQQYWGPPTKSDLNTAVGVFHQILFSNKAGVQIRCDKEKDKCSSKEVLSKGGYVDKDKGGIHLCPNVFTGETQLKFIEDICQDDWTLGDNNPTVFWSAALLNLFIQLPQITHSTLMHSTAWAYPNVLHAARLDPIASAHNIDTYLYFLLDNFAQQHIKGGCKGVHVSALIKDKKSKLVR